MKKIRHTNRVTSKWANTTEGIIANGYHFTSLNRAGIPEQVFTNINNAISFSFWQFGDTVTEKSLRQSVLSGGNNISSINEDTHFKLNHPWNSNSVFWEACQSSTNNSILKNSITKQIVKKAPFF